MSTAPSPVRAASTERIVALATSAAPVVTGCLAPFLGWDAVLAAGLGYGVGTAFMTANYMNLIPDAVLDNLPAGDIINGHKGPLFLSSLTSGMALGMGTVMGPEGTDALMAGVLTVPSIPSIVSLGWWTAVALVPWKLRRVLRRRGARPVAAVTAADVVPPPTEAEQILRTWARHISHPTTGTHRGQELVVRSLGPRRWEGTVTAPAGNPVTVTAEAISSAYRVPADWINLIPGAHTGEKYLTVNLVAPPEIDTSTLAGAWKKWVARSGGLMAGTHLADIQDDPNTGGQVARVIAGDTLDKLTHPDRPTLAGAMRVTSPLLISYEPSVDPREAVIRRMEHNPLEKGADFPGLHVLKPNKNGYIQIGPGVSGFPARVQLHDPQLGGQHIIVAGVTGSGKGGILQILALAHHVNRSAIIYGDPKGSSNPSITEMAAHSGLGLDESLGALRIWYHGLQHRIEQSKQLGMKNFKASPDIPWAPLILDETSKLCGESAEHRKEATFILNAGATLGRSLGMPIILANQLMQLVQFGGDAAIRDNVFYGGSLILLRSDSSQKHLVDLPETFAGCNPADIPPAWSGDRAMVYDPNIPLNDPVRTFGLCFAAAPGAYAEMSRAWTLEDATPYIDPANFTHPVDWPFWDERHELAFQSVLPGDAGEEDEDEGPLLRMTKAPKKSASADDKILKVLQETADPLGLEILYSHKNDIGSLARVENSTRDNALSRLVAEKKIHRQMKDGKVQRGMYGLGPAPYPDPADDPAEDPAA